MKQVITGITGGIGSGKSVVCRILEEFGYSVYYADSEAKNLLENNPDVKIAVINLLGEQAWKDGFPDREYIAKVVFNEPDKLESLNAIIHPAVATHFNNWVRNRTDEPILFKEAAIMFESGSSQQMNYIVAVTAPVEMRLERVMNRDGKSREQVEKIMSKQSTDEELSSKCDFTIVNDNMHPVMIQVMKILEQIKSRPYPGLPYA